MMYDRVGIYELFFFTKTYITSNILKLDIILGIKYII